jgi:RNA recognition motif-containing protein
VEDPVKKLFVGNLPFTVTEDRVRELFQEFGEIQSVTIPTDRETGKSRGFAFVEMANDDDAEKAIAGVNGKREGGRALNVNEARPKESGGGGGGHRGGGGGGGRGGYRY